MKSFLRHGMIGLALLGGLTMASAQVGAPQSEIEDGVVGRGFAPAAHLQLTDAQKNTIAEAVRRANRSVVAPPNFVVSVGAPVPPSIELYVLPDDALAQVPAAKVVKYTMLQNQLVLVDPTTMRVVDVVSR